MITLVLGSLFIFSMTSCEQDSQLNIPDNAVKPMAPTLLTVWAYPTDSTVLEWVDNSVNEDSFYVEESVNSLYNFHKVATLAPNTKKLVLPYRPQPNQYNLYRVKAANQVGESIWSNSATTRYLLAYTAQSTRGIHVVDCNDPATPIFFDSLSILNGDVQSLFIEGKTLYVTVKIGAQVFLKFYDITNPKDPILAGQISDLNYGYDILSTANRFYIAEGAGVAIYPKATIGIVSRVGFVTSEGQSMGVAVKGNYMYIAAGNRGIQVYNISDEANPVLVSRFLSTTFTSDILIEGDIAFVTDAGEGVVAVDISDPANLTFVSRYNTPGTATRLTYYNHNLYVSDSQGGVWILTMQDNDLTAVLNYDTPGKALSIFVNGTDFYVADDNTGMMILRNSVGLLERLSTYTTRGSSIKAVDVLDYR